MISYHRGSAGIEWLSVPGGFGTTEVQLPSETGIFAYWRMSRTWVAGNVGSQTEQCSSREPVPGTLTFSAESSLLKIPDLPAGLS